MYLPPATVMPETSLPPMARRSSRANCFMLPSTSRPPPVASAVTVEASSAASGPESWAADEPNRTCESTSSCGRLGEEVRLISGRAAVPLMFTVAVREGASQLAERSSRMRAGSLSR